MSNARECDMFSTTSGSTIHNSDDNIVLVTQHTILNEVSVWKEEVLEEHTKSDSESDGQCPLDERVVGP